MTRHMFFRILMSLLLLFSQQMANSHVLTHWSASTQTVALTQQSDEADPARAVAKDQSCNKCLVFAQFGAPLASCTLAVAVPAQSSLPVDGAVIAATHARTILAFQSRAPPQA